MKSIINFFLFVFSSKHRKQKWQNELNWNEKRIKIITTEITDIQKILPGAPTSLRKSLEHDYLLLAYHKNKEAQLKKKLGLS